jgi:hypothetical protein
MLTFRCLILFASVLPALTQTIYLPETAHTDMYFPHLADGGPASDRWQTRFTFINPNAYPAAVVLITYSDSGSALALDLGSGPTSQTTFTIPANGTTLLQSQIASSITVTGWAFAGSSLPVQANVAFRRIQNGVAKLEITAEPTLPSGAYRSVASPLVGVAVANVYGIPLAANVTVYGSAGQVLGQASLTIPAQGHSSFNLFQVPGVPAAFTGSFVLTPQAAGQYLLAWANYSDSSGVISSLPDGRAGFPAAQIDQIYNAFWRLVKAYQVTLPDFGATPQLVIGQQNDANAINAFARNGSAVQINMVLAELISDSPSELAFIIGHELGHIYQQRTQKFVWNPDREWDADSWGLLMSLAAGYDPYAGAGVLGKLGMATGTANLGIQLWEDSQLASDAHGSFSTRISNLTFLIETVCGFSPTFQSTCSAYKATVHPHFPASPSVPLVQPGGPLIDAVKRQQAKKLLRTIPATE